MPVEIREEGPGALAELARIPIAFELEHILDVILQDQGLGGIRLVERPAARPFVKDYDAIPGNSPADWPNQFDLSHWGFFIAKRDGQLVGGSAVAVNSTGLLPMLENRQDLALFWDLRVSPESRRQGIATALFAASEQWAKSRGCTELRLETQTFNVAACKFYASRGCTLYAIHSFAYPDCPEEVQLRWRKCL
jgi:GNAT superfamily N-acetyltransferase